MADSTIPTLRRALELLKERGWTQHYSAYSLSHGGPINLRTAISLANKEVADGEREDHVIALQALAVGLGTGIDNWQASRSRTHDKVVGKLEQIIAGLETDESHIDGRRAHRSDFGKRPPGKSDAGSRPTAL